MNEFINWFFENLYSNIFTIITVFASSIISLLISAYFYRIGNRNNLKISVIHPLYLLLSNHKIEKQNYEKINELSKEYSTRYMNNSERTALMKLLKCYEKVLETSLLDLYANALFNYFEDELKNHNIQIRIVPNVYENETYYDYPPEINDIYFALKDFLREKGYEYWDNYDLFFNCTIEEAISKIFISYSERIFDLSKVKFFCNNTADNVVKESPSYKKYQSDLSNLKSEIKIFKELKIYKSVQKNNQYH